ncbi:MAG: hypothetical protein M3Q95_02640, partial [Bacteroidota bacterium]|nr:hypothetical protein [Bacteroidota bacterium]
MKSNISLISRSLVLSMAVMFLMLVAVNQVKAQATCGTPANIANFGLDGDVHANTPVSIMGDSWFYSNVFPGSGIGVIGTTAATAIPAISASAFNSIIQGASNSQGRNRTYSQRMSVPYLTQVNGMTLIDAFAARDNISPDSTAFTASNKNGDNPTIWTLGVSTVPNKNDIIDVGGHLRRQTSAGSSASTINDLWMFAYVTKLSTSGDSYTDIEIFRTVPILNPSTGQLSNTGPSITGGHTAFTFNASASIITPGDIILCVNYNASGGVASVRIWCNINNLNGSGGGTAWFNAQPGRPFNFTGDFITGTGANG